MLSLAGTASCAAQNRSEAPKRRRNTVKGRCFFPRRNRLPVQEVRLRPLSCGFALFVFAQGKEVVTVSVIHIPVGISGYVTKALLKYLVDGIFT